MSNQLRRAEKGRNHTPIIRRNEFNAIVGSLGKTSHINQILIERALNSVSLVCGFLIEKGVFTEAEFDAYVIKRAEKEEELRKQQETSAPVSDQEPQTPEDLVREQHSNGD